MLRCIAAAVLAVPLIACSSGKPPHPAGTFEATVIEIAPVIAGRALVVRPQEGEAVAAGDTVLVLDTELLALQRVETAARRAGLAAQRRTAAADLAQALRRGELAATTLARAQDLLAQGSAAQQQVDDLAAERDVVASGAEAARGRIAAIDAELAHLETALAVLDRQLRDGVVVAPRGGVVLTRTLEPGEVAQAGRPVLRLADLDTLDLKVYLEAGDLDRVRLGERLEVLVDALGGERREGRVAWVSDEAEFTPKNAQTRRERERLVFGIKIKFDNSENILKPGMPIEVTF